MVKLRITLLPSAFVILFLFQWTVLSLNDELYLKNVLISDCESQLKCIFDNTNARGFCGIIPIHFLLEYKNVTFKYQNADFKDEVKVVWHKCDIVEKNSFMEGLPQKYQGTIENKLLGSAEFHESRTYKDENGGGLSQSIKGALDTYCSNGIQDIVGGLRSKCVGDETFSDESCGQSILTELINHSHLTVEREDQQVVSCDSNSKV